MRLGRRAAAWLILLFLNMACTSCGLWAQSAFPLRPDDPHAAYLAPESLGQGNADAADALQSAINHVQETTHQGIVFVPEGHYRLTHTVYVWSGIRLVGYGEHRPVFVLAPGTPGFQQDAPHYMIWFADERVPAGTSIADASEFTFYSALTNIDFELGPNNAAAVAIRFNVAQHGFISHANFHLATARAAIEAVGNQASDIHIDGGQYGIITGKTSPAWQFLLMDSSFTNQSVASIQTHDAGFTLLRDRFARTPIAIQIPDGQVEQLYGSDLEMSEIAKAAIELGDAKNLRSEITLEHVNCQHVARFARGGEDLLRAPARATAAASYVEESLVAGLEIGSDGREKGMAVRERVGAMSDSAGPIATDVPALPPMANWVNVHTLGVKGDGGTDDTQALQQAIDAHDTLYLPSGIYRLSGSLHLRANTALIGFNPMTTQFVYDNAEPKLQGEGPAIPVLIGPHGGRDAVVSIGIATGNANPRAAGIEWMAGGHSLLDDVSFFRGRSAHVAVLEPGAPVGGSSPLPMQLDAQHASLWVHDGGGGVFRGIWSHAGTAHEGLLIENTTTPGVIYQFSCEHHLRREVMLDHVAHWRIYDLQTEEEKPEGAGAVAIELEKTRDVLFANTYMYRVSRNVLPKLDAVVADDSAGTLFRNVKVFSQTRLAFDNAVKDQRSGVGVRAHDFAEFALSPDTRRGPALPLPAAFVNGGSLQRLATGFSNASGLTADSEGTIYFSDAANRSIYRWDAALEKPVLLARVEGSPMVLGFVPPSTLLAVDSEKAVAGVDVRSGEATLIPEASPNRSMTLLLPVGLHNETSDLQLMLGHEGYLFRAGSNTAKRSRLLPEHRAYYFSPGSQTAVMAGGTWRPLLQSSQLAAFAVGETHYLVSEDDAQTYKATLYAGESLTLELFAERGGTSVVTDEAGNVYIAGDQIFVYDAEGKPTGVLEVPERPSSLCFGDRDHRTLYIGARGSLYSIRTVAAGK